MSVEMHSLNFERNTQTGQWRVTCSCGWKYTGTQAECYSYSSGHDLDDTPTDMTPDLEGGSS